MFPLIKALRIALNSFLSNLHFVSFSLVNGGDWLITYAAKEANACVPATVASSMPPISNFSKACALLAISARVYAWISEIDPFQCVKMISSSRPFVIL